MLEVKKKTEKNIIFVLVFSVFVFFYFLLIFDYLTSFCMVLVYQKFQTCIMSFLKKKKKTKLKFLIFITIHMRYLYSCDICQTVFGVIRDRNSNFLSDQKTSNKMGFLFCGKDMNALLILIIKNSLRKIV